MSTYPHKLPDGPEKRRCSLCDRLKHLEELTRCGYESDDGRQAGQGLVCPRCVRDLPSVVVVNGQGWPLVFRAP